MAMGKADLQRVSQPSQTAMLQVYHSEFSKYTNCCSILMTVKINLLRPTII